MKKLDMEALLRARLDREHRADLDRLAPERLRVPSGALRRLEYRPGESPVLAVRLQELFGLRETPRVCEGDAAVALHLLSPAGRPVQVTQDLAGFWERTYPEVRRELKGRYPKHYWPDDPWSATPTTHTRPRRGR
ncbi:MAG: ATP-dependent helicase C-terminal domain-containing protein [Chromatiales bacterium]